jgi:hypothetical protein
MKFRIIAAAAAAVFCIAGSASAFTITSEAAALLDPALGHGVANGGTLANGQTMIDNFGDNGGSLSPISGFTFSPQVLNQNGGLINGEPGYIRSGPALLSGESAPPPIYNPLNPTGSNTSIAPIYEVGNYYTVTSDCGNKVIGCAHSATLQVTHGYLKTFSFYLGSPDPYNTVDFFVGNTLIKSLTGNQIWACPTCAQSGYQGFGARADYDFDGAKVTKIVFSTTPNPSNSFEFDNFAGTVGGVPEPMTWGLMIMGFAGIGAALRNRRHASATFA